MTTFVTGMNSWIGEKILSEFPIPFFSFRHAPRDRVDAWKQEISNVIDSGVFIGGKYVHQFEKEWASKVGTKFAIGVSNGFDGLTLALESLNLGQGSLVAVPAHTFIATWTSVVRVGLIPIGVDVDNEGLMDLNELQKISKEIKAVIPVHMHGAMVNMLRLQEICKEEKIFIIEDASQAHLASFNGKHAGSIGHVNVFSLYPTKNLGALGDAGIVTTNDPDIYRRIMEMRSYGSSLGKKYEHLSLGYNQRLDSIQAAILKVNYKYLSYDNDVRRKVANLYENELKRDYLKPLQKVQEGRVFHHYCILSENRDEIRHFLHEQGIETEIHYPNLAASEYSRMFNLENKEFHTAKQISKSILSLPNSPWHSEKQIRHVIATLNEFHP